MSPAISINDYSQILPQITLDSSNWNTSQGFSPPISQNEAIASIFSTHCEGRARWAISPCCRETNAQIKLQTKGNRGKEAKAKAKAIVNRSETNETRAKFSRRITQNAAHHVCCGAIMKPHSTSARMRSTPLQCNPNPLCLLLRLWL